MGEDNPGRKQKKETRRSCVKQKKKEGEQEEERGEGKGGGWAAKL